MTETSNEGRGLVQMVIEPSSATARWFVGLGVWGLLLAVLNLMGMAHPGYRISWAGVLSMGRLNAAFEAHATAPAFVASDVVFIALCGGLVALGFRTIANEEGSVAGFFRSLVDNSTWRALGSAEGGIAHTVGAWCLLVGLLFYVIRGVMHTNWFDPGVYAVSAVLVAFGFALRALALTDSDA
jgi:hypothetical protein